MVNKNETRVREALSRLRRIQWSDRAPYGDPSQIPLIKEFLRRTALWAKELKCTQKWPFFDVAFEINPKQRAPQETVEAFLEGVEDSTTRITKRLCVYYLHWEQLEEVDTRAYAVLLHPYEPIISAFEQGCRFYTEHGWFQCGMYGIPMHHWNRYDLTEPFYDQNP